MGVTVRTYRRWMRKPPWQDVAPHITALLRTPDIAHTDGGVVGSTKDC